MAAIGIALIWGGYAVSLWGFCLVRGINVTFGQLVNPVHVYSGAWTPGSIPATQVLPGGTSTGPAAQAA